jgi:flagellar biosynthesis GTPase FlhF
LSREDKAVTIKSFFADTVAEAIREARKELGEEAMLLKSRRAQEDARHLGAYEVVFGATEGVLADATPSTGTARAASASEGIWDEPSMALSVPAPATAPTPAARPRPSSASALYYKLIELDFDEWLAAEFAERVQGRLLAEEFSEADGSGPRLVGDDGVRRAIALEAERLLPRDSNLDGGLAALIGPPGGGKTSAIVRLAVAYGLAQKRHVVLLAASDHRVAAPGLLRQYAALLGVEFHEAASVDELRERTEQRNEGDLMLIDTPGYGPRDSEQAKALAEFLAERDEIQKHLVLPATLKGEDLQAPVERFEAFGTDRLLFTKLDEAARCGSAFSQAWSSRKPVSFLTTGQQVPGDLVPANRFDLAALLQTRDVAMASAA